MRPGIYIFKKNVRFRLQKSTQTSKWVKSIIRKEGRRCGVVNLIFCTDAYLLDLNRQFLKHDYFTDVITFEGDPNGKIISGEVYISIDRVRENSLEFNTEFLHELRRVIIHGVLHLLGYSDSTKALKNEMRLKEDACLSLLPSFT